MGLTVLELEIANPATPDVGERVKFLIDSGAVYSVVPAPVLKEAWRSVLEPRRVSAR